MTDKELGGEVKLEDFMEMATKLKEERTIYQSLICSPNVLEEIKKRVGKVENRHPFFGVQVFIEQHFPNTIVWLLDKELTQCYLRNGMAGLIMKMMQKIEQADEK